MSFLRYGAAIMLASGVVGLSACAVPGRAACTAGRYYANEFGGASTPLDSLHIFLGSGDGAGMPADGWGQSQTSSTQVTFRNGSNQAIAVKGADGWVVGPYTTCAT